MTAVNSSEPRYAELTAQIARRLLDHDGPVVILSHVEPDGDAIGSCLGLQRALRSLGKDATTYMDVPRYLRFVPEPGEIEPRLASWPENALLVVLDVDNNDVRRVDGADLSAYAGDVLNVDHHGTNRRVATLGLVDPTKAATALMVMHLVDALGAAWTPELATPVLLGINTDTGSFRFSNTSPEVLRAAADLVERGARLAWMNEMLSQQQPSYYALLREVLSSMEFLEGGLVVVARVDEAMLARAGAAWEDVESYVNVIRGAEGTELACLFKDFGDRTKLSLRSRGRVSAQNVAVACGGGGHVAAAGATVTAPYAEARALMERATRAELERVGLV
ncbi:DHH family phosphoesterase [Deinococcus pimensis]|uniref:DHH family phosphoesterase n=1 Tax=Deinococcus pimensis TaxID=309888 RepID=UPI000485B850|nr:bifunctional oligoribonuclease/PAP phosphatase NrnA [Deinococcus pimensis]